LISGAAVFTVLLIIPVVGKLTQDIVIPRVAAAVHTYHLYDFRLYVGCHHLSFLTLFEKLKLGGIAGTVVAC